MHPLSTLNHEQLLTLARKTHAAAHDHEPDRLEYDTLRLFQAFVDHLLAEQPALLQIAPREARMVERGQQRVVDLLVELAANAAGKADECRCDLLAADLVAELTVQADDERRALIAAPS